MVASPSATLRLLVTGYWFLVSVFANNQQPRTKNGGVAEGEAACGATP
jgi:hypothetical protein